MKLLKEALAFLVIGAGAVVAVVVVLRWEPWVSERERRRSRGLP